MIIGIVQRVDDVVFGKLLLKWDDDWRKAGVLRRELQKLWSADGDKLVPFVFELFAENALEVQFCVWREESVVEKTVELG